jgi:zinc transport system substrate-binding protein
VKIVKNQKTISFLLVLAFMGLILYHHSGFITNGRSSAPNRIKVAVSIMPQVEWLEEIGGDKIEVLSLIPAGQSPHSFSPTTTELTFVTNAKIWFQMGLIDFDIAQKQAISQVAPNIQIVNLSLGLELLPMPEHQDEAEGTDNATEDHDHGALDPHTWTSPTRVIQMVNTIATKLGEIDPINAATYSTNAATYIGKLIALNTTITELMTNVTNKNMLIFHPSYGYFCHDFGLRLIPLEEAGQDPSSKHYAKVLDEVKEEKVGVIFIQAEISENMAQSFARDAGVEIVRLYPLAKEYFATMNNSAYLIAEKLDQPPSPTKEISSYPLLGLLLMMGIGYHLVSKQLIRRIK